MALYVEVVSRERTVWKGEASYARVRTVDGELGIMPGLIPTLALLAEDGEMLIRPVEGEEIRTVLQDRKSTRLNSSHYPGPRMPSSA